MYSESQLLPVSALQHLLFCERQCALIHIERLWAENRFTVEGQHLHRKAHVGSEERRGNIRIVRKLWIRSFWLGLVGQADVVEFEERREKRGGGQRSGRGAFAGRFGAEGAVQFFLPGLKIMEQSPAWVQVTPIEYKRGRPKRDDSDRVQLCAQAMCLEEMLDLQIGSGELFYGKRQRRTHVEFDESLRAKTEAATARLHQMIATRETPPAVRMKKCDTCSLLTICLPDVTQTGRSATRFVGRQFAAALRDEAPVSDPFDTALNEL